MRRILTTILLALIAAACAAPAPDATTGPSAVARHLPTMPGPPGVVLACAGVGLETVLAGDPADQRVAWLEPFAGDGKRQDVVWPAGYSARFAPGLEILDEHGSVAIRAGDFVDGGCVVADDGVLELVPPFLSLRLVCGPIEATDCGGRVYQAATKAGWPGRDVVELRFLTVDGKFRATFADGSTMTGFAGEL